MSEILDDIEAFERLWEKLKGHLVVGTQFKTPEVPQPKLESTNFPSEYMVLVNGILYLAPGLSEVQLRKLVDEEKAKAAGLLTIEACIHLVASNLGFEIDGTTVKKKGEVETFGYGAPTLEDLGKAQVDMSVIDYLDLGKRLKPKKWLGDAFKDYNEKLKAFNYTYDGTEKVWLFQQGDEGAKPTTSKKTASSKGQAPKITRISDISDQKSVNIEGTLQFDSEQRDVNTKKGPTAVTDFKISDGSATAKVTFWGERGNMVLDYVKGDRLQVESLMVGEPYQGMPQLTAGRYTEVKKL